MYRNGINRRPFFHITRKNSIRFTTERRNYSKSTESHKSLLVSLTLFHDSSYLFSDKFYTSLPWCTSLISDTVITTFFTFTC